MLSKFWILCTLLGLSYVSATVWHECSVNETILQQHAKVSLDIPSIMTCAMHASATDWAFLLCVNDAATCDLWDVNAITARAVNEDLDSGYSDDSVCMTVPGCPKVDGTGMLKFGDLTKGYMCDADFYLKCQNNGYLEPIAPTKKRTNCDGGFTSTQAGCIMVNTTEMTYTEGRTYCLQHGADLFEYESADMIIPLSQYLKDNYPAGDYWTGAYKDVLGSWRWPSHRPVQEEAKGGLDDGGDDMYARIRQINGVYKLYDKHCGGNCKIICLAKLN